jgi:actin-related protein
MDNVTCINLDIGTDGIRIGDCGEERPYYEYNNYLRNDCIEYTDTISHNNNIMNHYNQELKYGMESGEIIDVQVMEQILKHALQRPKFTHSSLTVNDRPFILSQRAESAVNFSQDISELLFESLNIHSLLMESQNVLDLYCFGRSDGIVVNVGAGGNTIQTILQGTSGHFNSSCLRGGRHMSHLFIDKLKRSRKEFSFLNYDPCNVQLVDFWRTEFLKYPSLSSVILPDGTEVVFKQNNPVDNEIINFPRQLLYNEEFVHSILPSDNPATVTKLIQSMKNSSTNMEWSCLASRNIVLTGFVTHAPDMHLHVQKQLNESNSLNVQYRVQRMDDIPYTTWMGASILGSISTLKFSLFTRQMYEELGAYHPTRSGISN